MECSSSGVDGAPEAFPGPDTTSDDAVAPAPAPPPAPSAASSPPPPPPPIHYRRVRYKAATAYDAFGLPTLLPAARGAHRRPPPHPGAGLRDLLTASAAEGWSVGGGRGSAAADGPPPPPPPQRRTLYLGLYYVTQAHARRDALAVRRDKRCAAAARQAHAHARLRRRRADAARLAPARDARPERERAPAVAALLERQAQARARRRRAAEEEAEEREREWRLAARQQQQRKAVLPPLRRADQQGGGGGTSAAEVGALASALFNASATVMWANRRTVKEAVRQQTVALHDKLASQASGTDSAASVNHYKKVKAYFPSDVLRRYEVGRHREG